MVSKHKCGWLLPDPALGFLLEGLGSPRKGVWDFDPLGEVGNSLSCVEAALGSSPEALRWSELLREAGIPPFFGKVGISHGITGLPHPAAPRERRRELVWMDGDSPGK